MAALTQEDKTMSSAPMIEPAGLDEVLAYRHPGVVRRYLKEHNATPAEAEELFREMLKWLYLCSRGMTAQPEVVTCVMYPEIEKIDWMWHTFLLFTWDYAEFCERYFGFFLHHVPVEDEQEAPVEEELFRSELAQQYALVYDVLGEDTLTAWYEQRRYAAGS
jgi:hypothetical protein